MSERNVIRRITIVLISIIMMLGMIITVWAEPVTPGWKRDMSLYNREQRVGHWYQNADGSYPKSSWKQIGGEYYYFDEIGYLLIDTTTPDGYKVDRGGVWTENPIPRCWSSSSEWQTLLERYSTNIGLTVNEVFDEDGMAINTLNMVGTYSNFICAESFNPSADYRIKLQGTAQAMSIEEGHYLRSGSMDGKTPKTVTFQDYGSYNIYSPRVKNVTFKTAVISRTTDKVGSFTWFDDNYTYYCDENGEVDFMGRNNEIKVLPESN